MPEHGMPGTHLSNDHRADGGGAPGVMSACCPPFARRLPAFSRSGLQPRGRVHDRLESDPVWPRCGIALTLISVHFSPFAPSPVCCACATRSTQLSPCAFSDADWCSVQFDVKRPVRMLTSGVVGAAASTCLTLVLIPRFGPSPKPPNPPNPPNHPNHPRLPCMTRHDL